MSQVHYFEFVTSESNPEEAQICVPYKYMVIHLKCYKNLILAAILDAILDF